MSQEGLCGPRIGLLYTNVADIAIQGEESHKGNPYEKTQEGREVNADAPNCKNVFAASLRDPPHPRTPFPRLHRHGTC